MSIFAARAQSMCADVAVMTPAVHLSSATCAVSGTGRTGNSPVMTWRLDVRHSLCSARKPLT